MFVTALTLASLVACGEKAPPTAASAAAAGPKLTMELPDNGKARAFATTITSAATLNFSPSDNDGAKFEYTKMTFRGDGTWAADGYVEAMDERMECAEAGSWIVHDVESATVALISWTVTDTSCVGRDNGTKTMAKVTVGQTGIESARFR